VRPLTTDSKRTLRLVHAFDLAVSTLPDLAEGEAVEFDATHAAPDARCVVRRVADGFDVEGVITGASAAAARQGFAGVWLEVEEHAPDATHATVRRYEGERT
jgi:hypothetical protein